MKTDIHNQKGGNEIFLLLAYTSLVVSVVVVAGLGILACCLKPSAGMLSVLYAQMKDNLGDLVSGTAGVLLTFAASLFLFITYKEHNEQYCLTEQREQQTRFENTYFNMLEMLKEIRTSMTDALRAHGFVDIQAYVSKLRECYQQTTANPDTSQVFFRLNDISASNVEIDTAKETLGEIFDGFHERNNIGNGYFYRYVFHAINYVLDNKQILENEKIVKHYIDIIQAMLSDEELMLIFYDVLSKRGQDSQGNSRFYETLDRIGFFENIDEFNLLDRCHHHIYRHTRFKFLNVDELEAKS